MVQYEPLASVAVHVPREPKCGAVTAQLASQVCAISPVDKH